MERRYETKRQVARWSIRWLVALAAIGQLDGAPAHSEETPTCTSTAGQCSVESFYDGGSFTETETMVRQLDGASALTSTIEYPEERSLTTDWARPADPAVECSRELTCENGERIECYRDGPAHCGENGFAVWCGSFLPARYYPGGALEATVLTCRGLADPWPPLPPPTPSPKPKPNPKPQPKPGKPNPEPVPEEGCTPAEIRKVNAIDRTYVNHMFARTTAPEHQRSEMVVHHVPGRTSMAGKVFKPSGVENHQAVMIGDTTYWRTPAGPWLEMSAAVRRQMADRVPDGAASVDHSLFGPVNMVRAFADDRIEYYGIGPCEGALQAGDACFTYGFVEEEWWNIAYFAADSCLLVSVVGEDRNGPRSFVLEYPRELEVPAPDGEVVELSGDPAQDMPNMMRLMKPQP